MKSMPVLCSRCQVTRVSAGRLECRACADDSNMNKGFEWQVRKFLEDQDDLKHFTYTDTAVPCAAKTASNVRRADFTYVLMDRVVFLEVDENEHRYNSPECERKREQQLADSVPREKYVVLVRYNPLAKQRTFMQNLETLAEKLREGFVSDDVKLATDGIHRIFVGYQMATIRRLDAAYAEVQKNGLKRSHDHASTEQTWDFETQVEVGKSRHELTRDVARIEKLLLTKKELLSQLPAPLTWKEPDDGAKEFEALEDKLMKQLKKANGRWGEEGMMMVYPRDKVARESDEDDEDDDDEVFEPDVVGDPDHLEWFKAKFCYLCSRGKFYEYDTRKLYTKEMLFKRYITKKSVVYYIDKMTQKVVKKSYESARLWYKDKSWQSYYDLTHVPGGSRVIPFTRGFKGFPGENLLNDWTRMGD